MMRCQSGQMTGGWGTLGELLNTLKFERREADHHQNPVGQAEMQLRCRCDASGLSCSGRCRRTRSPSLLRQ